MNEEKIMPYFENELDDTQYYRTFELIQNFKYFIDNTTNIYESLQFTEVIKLTFEDQAPGSECFERFERAENHTIKVGQKFIEYISFYNLTINVGYNEDDLREEFKALCQNCSSGVEILLDLINGQGDCNLIEMMYESSALKAD